MTKSKISKLQKKCKICHKNQCGDYGQMVDFSKEPVFLQIVEENGKFYLHGSSADDIGFIVEEFKTREIFFCPGCGCKLSSK